MDQTDHTSGIGIYPAFFMIRLNPGESRKLTLSVQNHFSQPISVSTQGGEFAQDPSTLLNYVASHDSYNEWISAKDFTIGTDSTKDLTFTVTVPPHDTLTTGSYYPALILKFDTPGSQDTSQIEMEHAIPIYVEISEEAVAEVDVTKFSSDEFVIGSTIDISTEIINTGNTYTAPRAFIDMHKMNIINSADKTRIDSLPINQRRSTLLPGSVLAENISWGENSLGHYEATLYVLSQDTKHAVRQVDFWIIPAQWILVGTAAIAILIAFILLRIFKKSKKGKKTKRKKPKMKNSKNKAKFPRIQELVQKYIPKKSKK